MRQYHPSDPDSIEERVIQGNGLELRLHLHANQWRAASGDKERQKAIDETVRDYLSRRHFAPAAISTYFQYYQSKKYTRR